MDTCETGILCTLWQFGPRHALIVATLSVLLPLSIFSGQGNVRRRRLALVDKLIECAARAEPQRRAFVSRSLDFVRARYVGPPATERRIGLPPWIAYAMPVSLFVILSAVGFSSLFLVLGLEEVEGANLLLSGPAERDPLRDYQVGTVAVLAAAFLGAYIWSIHYLVLRIANDDLNPLSFLRVSEHVLLSVLLAGILRHFMAAWPGAASTLAAVLGLAFLLGLFPRLGIDVLVDRMPGRLRLKRPVPGGRQIAREFPLDLIDGIDAPTKFRLASLEIADAQALATADPIRVYLESPYGLLRILDWIGQAQLLTAVGPKRHLACREANIRDILMLLSVGGTPEGAATLRSALGGPDASEGAVAAVLEGLERTLHVQRLVRWSDAFTSFLDAPLDAAEFAATGPEGPPGRESAPPPVLSRPAA